ncbi:T9SS type A sorting domain-containing protein [Winogradskyella poriferorum]|uniref:T9SS type A sorting domain-containing protein n=1 Tax=Winogradskyella poriferorum TaxID=307627 RepID=UPI003D65E803
MKKITFLLMALMLSFIATAQSTCTDNFTTSGTDAGPTVLTINSGDISCFGSNTPTSMQLTNSAGSLASTNCDTSTGTSYYVFTLAVSGGTNDGLSVTGCGAEFDGTDITGFTSLTITSADTDAFEDSVTITIDVEVTYPTPSCTSPAATASVVESCPTYSVDVDITDLGDASSVAITNDAGVAATTGITALGVVTVGPFDQGTPVNLTLEHEQDGLCSVPLGSFADTCPPLNDICSGAIDVACDETVTGDTSASSVTDTVGNSSADLWYSYSGAAGDITASLCGSSYDTNVRVYDSCGGTQIATNDDACGTRSEVTFTADGSSTYYIAVEGYSTAEGAFTMTLTCLETVPPPANDAFADAEALVTGVATSGTTAGATENLADEKPSCDLFGNIADVWYTYTQPANTDTMIITTSISGTSSEANCAVYSAGEPILAENQVACGDEGQASGEMLEFAATPGTTYYIRVWSDGALPPVSGRVEGTFNVTADAALSTDEFDNPAVFTYYPNPVKNTLTLNAQNNIEDVRVYNMLGQEVMNAQPQAVDSDIDMSSLETGTYFVQVTIASITKTVRVIKQ